MKIREVRAVTVALPRQAPRTPARRPSWNASAPRGLPMNKYPEFPPSPPARPGSGRPWAGARCGCGSPPRTAPGGWAGAAPACPSPPWSTTTSPPCWQGRDCFATRVPQRPDVALLPAPRGPGAQRGGHERDRPGPVGPQGEAPGAARLPPPGGPGAGAIPCYITGDDLDWSLELGFRAFKVTNPAHYEQGIAGINLVEEKIAAGPGDGRPRRGADVQPGDVPSTWSSPCAWRSACAPTSCAGWRSPCPRTTWKATPRSPAP